MTWADMGIYLSIATDWTGCCCRDMGAVVESQGLASRGVDAILLDLGMSSMQVASATVVTNMHAAPR